MDNKYDSISCRIQRKIDKEDKLEPTRIVKALYVSQDNFKANSEELSSQTKIIRFKFEKLNEGNLYSTNN